MRHQYESPKGTIFAAQDASVKDARRLNAQCTTILNRLKQGRASNVELARISLKYTSRISDLRAEGFTIECERGEGGVNWYTLEVAG